MSWRNHWNRKLEGWVERRRHFRKLWTEKLRELPGLKAREVSRETVPNRVLDPREVR